MFWFVPLISCVGTTYLHVHIIVACVAKMIEVLQAISKKFCKNGILSEIVWIAAANYFNFVSK